MTVHAVDRAIIAAYRDLGWSMRQCSYAFGPSVKTIRRILDRAGVARRSPRECHSGGPSPAELVATLRYAQRGLTEWTRFDLPGGCDDAFVAAAIIGQVFCGQGSTWSTRYHPVHPHNWQSWDRPFARMVLASRLIGRDLIWLSSLAEPDQEFYLVGPSAAGWWYARPRGDGTALGWCAPTQAELVSRLGTYQVTRISPSQAHS